MVLGCGPLFISRKGLFFICLNFEQFLPEGLHDSFWVSMCALGRFKVARSGSSNPFLSLLFVKLNAPLQKVSYSLGVLLSWRTAYRSLSAKVH